MLLYRAKNIQIFVFKPQQSYGKNSAYGFHVRKRKERVWTHVTLRLFQKGRKPPSGARGIRSWEILSWKTSPGVHQHRITYKKYIRFKVGFGGIK